MKKIMTGIVSAVIVISIVILFIVSAITGIISGDQSELSADCNNQEDVLEEGNIAVSPGSQPFIQSLKEGAIQAWLKERVLPSALIAQIAHETGYGSSQVYRMANNTGGIKFYSGVDYGPGARESNQAAPMNEGGSPGNGRYYTWFPSPSASALYQAKMFSKPPYTAFPIRNNRDAKNVCQALGDSPYAADPSYASKLFAVIQSNHLTAIDEEAFKMEKEHPELVQKEPSGESGEISSEDSELNDLCLAEEGTTVEVVEGDSAPTLAPPPEYVGKLKYPLPDGKTYAGNNYPFGQCTYGAYNRMAQIGHPIEWFPGDGGNGGWWWSSAKAKGYEVVKAKPQEGWAVSFPPGAPYDPYAGHIAVVEYVNPDGSFLVSEANVVNPGSGTISWRVISASSAQACYFIKGKGRN